jgi:hypothetical protein
MVSLHRRIGKQFPILMKKGQGVVGPAFLLLSFYSSTCAFDLM